MARPARSLAFLLLRRGLSALGAIIIWTVWLLLALAIGAQGYIATHHELAVPGFVLRALEQRLAASGLRADFGRTQFDPSGRILIRDVRLRLPGFEDPVVTAGAIYGRLDWWALLAGRFEPLEVRVTSVSARVPAVLSPSGEADEIVRDLDATFFPRGADVAIAFVTARIGKLNVAGQGTVHLAAALSGSTGPLPLAELIGRQYALWSRTAAAASPWLDALGNPRLRVELSPLAPGVSRLDFALSADSARAPGGDWGEATGVRVFGSWVAGAAPGLPARLGATARRLVLPGGTAMDGVSARLSGLQNGLSGQDGPVPQTVDFSARQATAQGVAVTDPFGLVQIGNLPRVQAAFGAWSWDHPVRLVVEGDTKARSGTVDFDLAVGSGVLDTLNDRWQSDLRGFLSWTEPIALTGRLRLGSGGKFAGVSGTVAARGLVARGVMIDELRGELEFDGARLIAPRAYARLGEDFARGSFQQDLATNQYRFLLDGRLRPLHITPWIAGDWWKEFFGNLSFPRQGPDANIDLSGCWTDGRQAKIFLRVDVPGIAIQGMPLDGLKGSLFIRPQFTDVLEFSAERSGGVAEGNFVRRFDLEAGDWRSLDVKVNSTLDPLPPLKLLGGPEAAAIADFTFVAPPHLAVAGHFDGPASGRGVHRSVQVGMHSDGQTSYRGIPIERLSFDAALTDDAIALTGVDAAVLGGSLGGNVTLSGSGPTRRIDLSAAARDVSLSQAAALVQQLSASPPGTASAKTQKFLQEKSSVKIDASLSAQGNLASLDSFHGLGNAQLHGGEIGEIHMLGMLSQLLRFTTLRFKEASASFRLDGEKLDFPEVVISGANSAITAHGTYSIALHQLDFRARLDPFKQSQGATRKFMDLVLTPLSNALEVRLTGSVEKPKWAFVNGPTNFLSGLRSPNTPAPVQTGFANPP